jgi:hypothetical protein
MFTAMPLLLNSIPVPFVFPSPTECRTNGLESPRGDHRSEEPGDALLSFSTAAVSHGNKSHNVVISADESNLRLHFPKDEIRNNHPSNQGDYSHRSKRLKSGLKPTHSCSDSDGKNEQRNAKPATEDFLFQRTICDLGTAATTHGRSMLHLCAAVGTNEHLRHDRLLSPNGSRLSWFSTPPNASLFHLPAFGPTVIQPGTDVLNTTFFKESCDFRRREECCECPMTL